MSAREAFVQAIAANPADDLPRLVFADWLDEHGEPERAEFIRTQIRWHHTTDEEEKRHLNRQAADLFREHWHDWLGPFLLALEPDADLTQWFQFRDTGHAGMIVTLSASELHPLAPPLVESVSFSRGFVQWLSLDVMEWAGGSLSETFGHEPVRLLGCSNAMHSPNWNRFTDPVLRRVEWLSLTQRWAWNVSAPDSGALLSDPHLAGVREFSLSTEPGADGVHPPLPVAWLEAFTRSPLAYRLTGLCLTSIGANGIAPLCRPGRLHLERLELGGELNAMNLQRLGASDLAGTVQALRLQSPELGNTGAVALTRDEWRKLTRLGLSNSRLTAAVLPSLASAVFTPQLRVLDLSGNPLFTGDDRDTARLERLAEVLDPERLEYLNLTDTGLSHVPDFLAERFGDRVTM